MTGGDIMLLGVATILGGLGSALILAEWLFGGVLG